MVVPWLLTRLMMCITRYETSVYQSLMAIESFSQVLSEAYHHLLC